MLGGIFCDGFYFLVFIFISYKNFHLFLLISDKAMPYPYIGAYCSDLSPAQKIERKALLYFGFPFPFGLFWGERFNYFGGFLSFVWLISYNIIQKCNQ